MSKAFIPPVAGNSIKQGKVPIILGIDPGSQRTGYGFIQIHQGKPHYLASGCIMVKGSLPHLFTELQTLIADYQPTEAAIEQVFVNCNPRAALVLGEARGIAKLALELAQLPTQDYATRQVKQAVVGYGGANKFQIQQMVKQLLYLSEAPPSDPADALAIALCHAQYAWSRLFHQKEIA